MFRSNHRGALILVVLLIAAAWMLAYKAAVAANPVSTLPDTKIHRAGELKINPEKHDFGQVLEFAHSAPLTVTVTNKIQVSFDHLQQYRCDVAIRDTERRMLRLAAGGRQTVRG